MSRKANTRSDSNNLNEGISPTTELQLEGERDIARIMELTLDYFTKDTSCHVHEVEEVEAGQIAGFTGLSMPRCRLEPLSPLSIPPHKMMHD